MMLKAKREQLYKKKKERERGVGGERDRPQTVRKGTLQEAEGLPGRPEITVLGWLATDSPRETNPFQFQVKTCPPCQVFLCQSPSIMLSTLWLTLQEHSHTLPSAGLVNGPRLWESGPGEHDAKVCSSAFDLATSLVASISVLYQLAWTVVSL